MRVFKGLIYKAKRGRIYDPDNRKYNCYSPIFTGDYHTVDCFICDQNGKLASNMERYVVPVGTSNLGSIINKLDDLIL
jgi:hypothetical protein